LFIGNSLLFELSILWRVLNQ